MVAEEWAFIGLALVLSYCQKQGKLWEQVKRKFCRRGEEHQSRTRNGTFYDSLSNFPLCQQSLRSINVFVACVKLVPVKSNLENMIGMVVFSVLRNTDFLM